MSVSLRNVLMKAFSYQKSAILKVSDDFISWESDSYLTDLCYSTACHGIKNCCGIIGHQNSDVNVL